MARMSNFSTYKVSHLRSNSAHREGTDQEVDGQRLNKESLRSLSQGLRLHNWPELKTATTTGHKASGTLPDPAISQPLGQGSWQETVSSWGRIHRLRKCKEKAHFLWITAIRLL